VARRVLNRGLLPVGVLALLATFLVGHPASGAGPVPAFASSDVSGLRFSSVRGLSTLAWQQRVQVNSAFAGPNLLASAPAVSLPAGAATMPDHGRLMVGLFRPGNAVYPSEASVRGKRLHPGVWLRSADTMALAPGDTYTTATTEFAWPTVTAPGVAKPERRSGTPMLTLSPVTRQVLAFKSTVGEGAGAVSTLSGYLRAAGGDIDGSKTPVAVSARTVALPAVDPSKPTLVFVMMTSPGPSGVHADGVDFEMKPRPHLTFAMKVKGRLAASHNRGSASTPAYTNTASFFVTVIQGTQQYMDPGVVAGMTVDAPPGSTLQLLSGSTRRAWTVGSGPLRIATPLDDPVDPLPHYTGVQCSYTVFRGDDPGRVSAVPAPVRGHVSLGTVGRDGRSLAELGRLTAGRAVVDGVTHELVPGSAELITVSQLPPWERPYGTGPLSPALTDGVGAWTAGCPGHDDSARITQAHDAYGGAGGTHVRAVWDLGSVVVEASLIATSSDRSQTPGTSVLGRLDATSRDGQLHVVGLSLGLVGITAPLLIAEPTTDPGAPLLTSVSLAEAPPTGFVPVRIDTKLGRFRMEVIGDAAPPDGFSLAGRYAGPSVTSVTSASTSMNPVVVPGLPLGPIRDVFFSTGAGVGAGVPSYFGSLLVAVRQTPTTQ